MGMHSEISDEGRSRVRRPWGPTVDRWCELASSTRGAVLVEMAIVLPVLLALVMGVVSYGRLMFVSHMVQQAANDGARAAVAGLDAPERRRLAVAAATRAMERSGVLEARRGLVAAAEADDTVTISIRYDVRDDALLHLPFVPDPGPWVAASGSALTGGL